MSTCQGYSLAVRSWAAIGLVYLKSQFHIAQEEILDPISWYNDRRRSSEAQVCSPSDVCPPCLVTSHYQNDENTSALLGEVYSNIIYHIMNTLNKTQVKSADTVKSRYRYVVDDANISLTEKLRFWLADGKGSPIPTLIESRDVIALPNLRFFPAHNEIARFSTSRPQKKKTTRPHRHHVTVV